MTAPPPTTLPPQNRRSVARLAGLILFCLLINFVLRLPTSQVADWGQFSFYDPGTVLKGDMLLAKGYVPTVDFGYTHGLLSLLYGHVGFAILGRTPLAFLLLTLLTEVVMAWSVARILCACNVGGGALFVFIAALPMAIMPAYLTLTHPLEAMLILLALAEQVEGKPARSLSLMSVCLFVKPSMAYVYGFLLMCNIVWRARGALRPLMGALFPAAITLLVMFGSLSLWMGVGPVVRTLLPTTGAKTYAATHFGFFNQSGRDFWWPEHPLEDFLTPAAVFLLFSAALALAGMGSAIFFLRRGRSQAADVPRARTRELLLTIALLHTAFLVGFYGWTGSWTYYSYLPMLGAPLLIMRLTGRNSLRISFSIIVLAMVFLSHVQLVGDCAGSWNYKIHSAASGGLWAYQEQLQQWQNAVDATAGQPTLVMTNGVIPNLPPNLQLPDAWFPEPGIPTRAEIERVKVQASHATCIILWWEYRRFDLWNSPQFSDVRGQFETTYQNERFTVLRRR